MKRKSTIVAMFAPEPSCVDDRNVTIHVSPDVLAKVEGYYYSRPQRRTRTASVTCAGRDPFKACLHHLKSMRAAQPFRNGAPAYRYAWAPGDVPGTYVITQTPRR